jgi:hypothetical protein
MNRRKFIGAMVGGVAVSAAVRTFPFRVYSFPATIDSYVKYFWSSYNVNAEFEKWLASARENKKCSLDLKDIDKRWYSNDVWV